MTTGLQADADAGHSAPRRDFLRLAAYLGVALVAPPIDALPAPGLGPRELALVADVAELIIPATDTGGARAAGVPAFIDMMVTQWFNPDERTHFLEELQTFGDAARVRYGRPFVDLNEADQGTWFGEQLAAAERGMIASPIPILPRGAATAAPRSSFAALMKRLTVVGFYTSELGATQELNMTVIFDNPPGCAPVKQGERADSLALYNIPFSAY